jgi:hypothetical protein
MLTIKEIIATKAPQYSSIPRLDDLIEIAKLLYSETVFGNQHNYAFALEILHQLTKESMTNGSETDTGLNLAGSISQRTVRSLTLTYSGGAGSSLYERFADLATTGYGEKLISLIKSCVIPII